MIVSLATPITAVARYYFALYWLHCLPLTVNNNNMGLSSLLFIDKQRSSSEYSSCFSSPFRFVKVILFSIPLFELTESRFSFGSSETVE